MPLLKKFKTAFGIIRVTQNKDGTRAYYQNGCYHSQATASGVSLCEYIHVAYQIMLQKKCKNVLIIGCGGGTLATMLRRKKIAVTIIDINPVAFNIARDYFNMPDDVECVAENGIAYVQKTAARYDAVVIDVFDSDNTVPRGFTNKTFLGAAKKILKRGGIIIMNVMIKNSQDRQAYAIARNIKKTGMKVNFFEWSKEKDSNIILVGGSVKGVAIPSGSEPSFIKKELKAMTRNTIA